MTPHLAVARRFVSTVIMDFRRSRALVLSGAVAYNTLLSIVPLFAVLLIALSHLVDEQRLLDTVTANLELLIPGQADAVTAQVARFLARRQVVGSWGSWCSCSSAPWRFTVLETAMAVIFYHRAPTRPRYFVVSALIPYVFIMLLGIGLLIVTIISGALEAVGRDSIVLFGHRWSLAGVRGRRSTCSVSSGSRCC